MNFIIVISFKFSTEMFFSNNVIWFLLALFWDSVILYFIVKYVSNKYCRILMTLVIGMIGILLGENKVNIPLYVDTAFTAFPFLFLGFLGKEYDVLNKIVGLRTVMKYSLLIGVFVVGFIVDYIFGEVASMVNNSQTGILQFYGCAIAGSLSVIALSMIINRLPLITFLGRNSIVVLCTQMYIINVVVKILKMIDLNYYVSSLLVMLVVCLSYYIVTPIIKKYVPWIIGDIM